MVSLNNELILIRMLQKKLLGTAAIFTEKVTLAANLKTF